MAAREKYKKPLWCLVFQSEEVKEKEEERDVTDDLCALEKGSKRYKGKQ